MVSPSPGKPLLLKFPSVSAPQVDDIVGEYKDCFEGLGKMKDKAAKLHVNSSARPLAQKFRRLPFHVREQVEAELKNLEELDIIERAEGPTPWVSPIVVVPKKTGIRICVDMRAANQAIERERHPVPTVEDPRHRGLAGEDGGLAEAQGRQGRRLGPLVREAEVLDEENVRLCLRHEQGDVGVGARLPPHPHL